MDDKPKSDGVVLNQEGDISIESGPALKAKTTCIFLMTNDGHL